jgi:hypothetical protein
MKKQLLVLVFCMQAMCGSSVEIQEVAITTKLGIVNRLSYDLAVLEQMSSLKDLAFVNVCWATKFNKPLPVQLRKQIAQEMVEQMKTLHKQLITAGKPLKEFRFQRWNTFSKCFKKVYPHIITDAESLRTFCWSIRAMQDCNVVACNARYGHFGMPYHKDPPSLILLKQLALNSNVPQEEYQHLLRSLNGMVTTYRFIQAGSSVQSLAGDGDIQTEAEDSLSDDEISLSPDTV